MNEKKNRPSRVQKLRSKVFRSLDSVPYTHEHYQMVSNPYSDEMTRWSDISNLERVFWILLFHIKKISDEQTYHVAVRSLHLCLTDFADGDGRVNLGISDELLKEMIEHEPSFGCMVEPDGEKHLVHSYAHLPPARQDGFTKLIIAIQNAEASAPANVAPKRS